MRLLQLMLVWNMCRAGFRATEGRNVTVGAQLMCQGQHRAPIISICVRFDFEDSRLEGVCCCKVLDGRQVHSASANGAIKQITRLASHRQWHGSKMTRSNSDVLLFFVVVRPGNGVRHVAGA